MPVILPTEKAEIRRPGLEVRPYLKKPFTKIGLVEWLKVKALSLSPSTTKKKKKERKKRNMSIFLN
jgi:hypothetical protein